MGSACGNATVFTRSTHWTKDSASPPCCLPGLFRPNGPGCLPASATEPGYDLCTPAVAATAAAATTGAAAAAATASAAADDDATGGAVIASAGTPPASTSLAPTSCFGSALDRMRDGAWVPISSSSTQQNISLLSGSSSVVTPSPPPPPRAPSYSSSFTGFLPIYWENDDSGWVPSDQVRAQQGADAKCGWCEVRVV